MYQIFQKYISTKYNYSSCARKSFKKHNFVAYRLVPITYLLKSNKEE